MSDSLYLILSRLLLPARVRSSSLPLPNFSPSAILPGVTDISDIKSEECPVRFAKNSIGGYVKTNIYFNPLVLP